MARKMNNIDTIYELNIDEHVQQVDPLQYGISDFETINPHDYFISSGDAVIKAMHLDSAMWRLAGEARKKYGNSKNKKHRQFQEKLWECAGNCRSLLNKLKKIRGDHIFLETDWRDHKLYCCPKDPRSKRDD